MSKIYEVYCLSDMTEGRGGMRFVNAFANEDDAWAFADEHKGCMEEHQKIVIP